MTSSTIRVAAADGTGLLVRRWEATPPAWARIVLVHGIAEHSGRYEHVGDQFAAAGLDVTGYDQRGFGASDGRRAYVDRWARQHDDLEERLAEARAGEAGSAGLPVALFGHSLGGLVILGYLLTDRPKPDVAVLSAPAIDSDLPAWRLAGVRLLARVAPTASVSNALDTAVLSRDPAVGERYLADPLTVHSTTARFGAEALAEQRRVRAALSSLAIPTLVVHGADDGLVPAASSEPLGSLPGVTRRVYPGLRHELHNEPEGPEVIDDVIAWLRENLRSDGAVIGSRDN